MASCERRLFKVAATFRLRDQESETQAKACGYGDMRGNRKQAQDRTCGYGEMREKHIQTRAEACGCTI